MRRTTKWIEPNDAEYVMRWRVDPRCAVQPDIELGDHLLWMGRIVTGGYGTVTHQGHLYAVHRLAWIAAHGEEPKGYLRNTCGHPSCVRPDHWRDLGR